MHEIKKRILIVDDEHDIALMLRMVLENKGFAADSFTEPEVALKSFKPGSYDLLILDIKMPKINGFELYNRLKSKDKKPNVLFLTALSNLDSYDNERTEAYPLMGERHFAQKPISNAALLEQVYSLTN